MFKSWQILVFSLIPLALVFAGVVIGSMDGIDAEREVFPTQAAVVETETPAAGTETPAAGTQVPPSTPGAPQETVIHLVAENILFDQRSLTAAAGAPVTIEFENRDAGVLHNFALYVDNSVSQKIFGGDLTTGPVTVTYSFEAPAPGTYFFRCDVHPDTMTGSFITQ